ncbi:hypothetical protein P8452_16158 [Trifolium repens]|nr:hypothetical protein P8452_16158 [Trifolium repens]
MVGTNSTDQEEEETIEGGDSSKERSKSLGTNQSGFKLLTYLADVTCEARTRPLQPSKGVHAGFKGAGI